MKKTARRILAAIMVLAMMLACVPMASAANTPDDGGYYYEEYSSYDGVVRIPYGKITNLTFTKSKGARSFYIYTSDCNIISIPDGNSPAMYGINDGAAFVYVEQFDKNDEYISTLKYIVVVYDSYDAQLTGRVTDVWANNISMKCEQYAYADCNVETEGDVYYYFLTDNITWDCTYACENGGIYAFDRGTDSIQLFVVDTNGNVVSTTFDVTVRFTFVQWIRYIFTSMFFWMYR